ncbi:MAG: hypothetical protein IPI90_04900 [Saprospiraceae bacterium]|nr:hypothetical protein [Candidatus Vicinibacter affinis]
MQFCYSCAISLAGFDHPKAAGPIDYAQLYSGQAWPAANLHPEPLEIIKKSDPLNPEKIQQILKSIHSSRLNLNLAISGSDTWIRSPTEK